MAATSKSSVPKSSSSKLPLLFLLLTVGILAAGGYFVYTTVVPGATMVSPLDMVKQVTSGGALGPRVSESDFKDIEDPLIRKHLAAQINIGRYRIRSTSNGMDDKSEQLMEFVMKGSDVLYRMSQKTGGKDTLDMITIGDTTYLKDFKDGSWWKQTAKPSTDLTVEEEEEDASFKPEDLKEEYMAKTSVKYTKLGEEACGTLTCHKYEEVDAGNPEGKRTFWFDTKELLLRREQNGFGEFLSVQEYSYDNLNIVAPSPTKDVPEGKNIYDYMVAGMMGEAASGEGQGIPSAQDIQKMMDTYQNETSDDSQSYDTGVSEEGY